LADTEEFLTVAEVAELLKLNQQTVRNWIDQGSLPAVRVGRRVRIKRSDFDRIVEAGYRAARRPDELHAGANGPDLSEPGAAEPGSSERSVRMPSAADFWSGEPVGEIESGPNAGARRAASNGGES
jgi:excisionase family DNA binding protein